MQEEKNDKSDMPSLAPRPSELAVMSLNDTKAGMVGLDKEKINAIIAEASQGSKFYTAKAAAQERIDNRVERIRGKRESLTEKEIQRAEREAEQRAEELKSGTRWGKTIVHVDMDAYYAAVEMLDNPSLKDKPMAVGGMGMLSTSNYQARKFGVRAGMPGFIGKKLCPELVLVKPNFKRYKEISELVRSVFREYDPGFSPMSLDEAYLDLTEHLEGLQGSATPDEVVHELRGKIEAKTQLTASAGIAPNALLAKICSDLNKPNGQYRLLPNEDAVAKFVKELPIRKIGGVGNVSEQQLRGIDVKTCGDLWTQRGYLKLLFSETAFDWFLRVSLGIGATSIAGWNDRERKSLSTETTFRDTDDVAELRKICSRLVSDLAADLAKKDIEGRAVTLKIKTHTFKIKSKVLNLLQYTADEKVINTAALKILRQLSESAEEKPLKLRLMGVRMSEFRGDDQKDEGAKQKTLDAFLKKDGASSSAVQMAAYPCPICEKEVPAPSESAFNSHLDRCLQGTPAGDENNEEASVEKENSLTLSDRSSKEESASELSKASSSPPSSGERVQCPVCASSVHQYEINSHIDECLNTGVLNEINQQKKRKSESEGRNLGSSRESASAAESSSLHPPHKKQKKAKGIESYFERR